MTVRALFDGDRPWLRALIAESWGLPIVSPGGTYADPASLNGFVAEIDREPVGAATYATADDGWEVVTLEATRRLAGVGRRLVGAVCARAMAAAAARVWLATTDDNPGALSFYGRVGFSIVATHPRFIDVVRATKPDLPADAFTDAIELEWHRRG